MKTIAAVLACAMMLSACGNWFCLKYNTEQVKNYNSAGVEYISCETICVEWKWK